MSDFNPTAEQVHILRKSVETSENVMIDALAGTGKTTTAEQITNVVKQKPILYLVFNKKNALEAEEKLTGLVRIKTLNGLGHTIWSTGRRVTLQKTKTQDHLRDLIGELKSQSDKNIIWEIFWPLVAAVGLAKNVGYVPEGKYPTAKRLATQEQFYRLLDEEPDDLMSELIDALLIRSIREAMSGHIDYDDQVYMPAMFGGVFPKFPCIIVDEYQDLNPCNHAIIAGLMRHRSRLFGVGDPWQNIYGFRGAKAGGMNIARKQYNMSSCDLSISFRCPQEIVRHVQWHVPKFKWFKAGGSVRQPDYIDPSTIDDAATFICRNNAPLFSMALRLLAVGRSVSVAGSEVGPRIVGIMKRLGHGSMNQDGVFDSIEAWREAKLERESKTANDIADCMLVFASHGQSLDSAVAYAEHLFSQEGSIQFLTGHKAKGLEFPDVYHLDPWLCRATEQDNNLRYVISTRSQDRLCEIDSDHIHW